MTTFAEKVISFHKYLCFDAPLGENIQVMNPFSENEAVLHILEQFYTQFFRDTLSRRIVLGINPGRLGAGATGIPFTDTKRLAEDCGIETTAIQTHEPSSVFVYDMINAYGGSEKFYSQFYINSVCPLGFIEKNKKGNWVNCNYYDYPELFEATKDFIITTLKEQIAFGIDTSVCYILGKKNAKFFKKINDEAKLFDSFVVFDHPRYIVQYKLKQKEAYIEQYLRGLGD
ncbi:uracil-DNA glycosylase family protein [Maribacter aurantiacus]|uniref:SMUG2 DNA glycosylase family protein n=1 Tax=Maribacter aurantiacus TaxID=1882343 RepID=A0A5R8LYS3_9FLAO|nr:uracil-DNA glycosylase family protein [Maribacter aurantiacus]TLF42572.1 SMUG2 DNA glycosylase family protein [Maribacter aurantiacus]